ncbi:MAG: DUF6804 family protein [Candidatus Taylorbacteria bacterium]
MSKYIRENWYSILAGIMLLLAIPSVWPYSYFQLLRWVVMVVAIYNAYTANKREKTQWVYIMGAIAILFNPIFPIFFSKGTWIVLDLIATIVMFVSATKIKK